MKKNFTYGIAFICTSLFVIGCSEVNNDLKESGFHGNGFVDASSENFHGKLIKTREYDIQGCKSCHGFDYSGGTANKSCLTCHNQQNGPENCTTCHGSVNAAPPKDLSGNSDPAMRGVGAHQKHILGGTLGAPVACSECHNVPQKVTDAGHLDNSLHAEVMFDSTSNKFKSNAIYDASSVSCTNTYCHGNFNGGNQDVTMKWTEVSSNEIPCGTCHGDVNGTTPESKAFPRSGHPAIGTVTCVQCHGNVINSSMAIINPSKHMNGKVD